jgi:long-chain fatty acid transport protein
MREHKRNSVDCVVRRPVQKLRGSRSMTSRKILSFGAAVIAFATVAGAPSEGYAGGFAVREQSTSAQGASFAGSAAGFDLSSMFWNPAAVTTKDGMNSESHAAIILGQSKMTAEGGSLTALSLSATSGNIADPALITTSYANYQFGKFYFGLSLNAPFGLTTKPEERWQGQALGRTSKLITVNASPTVGYKVMPGVSIAAGVQVQYIDARLSSLLTGTSATGNAIGALTVKGNDIGFGFTAGILLEPAESTTIGLGFRSMVSHKLKGDQSSGIGASDVEVSAELPEIVTLSVRQKVAPAVTLLGSAEWTNWSRLGQLEIKCTSIGGACAANDQTLSTLEFNYDDG